MGLNEKLYPNAEFVFPETVSEKANTIVEAFTSVFYNPPWPEPAFYSKRLKPEDIPFHPNHWTMVPRSPKFQNGYLKNSHKKSRSFRVLDWGKPSWTVAYGNREIHIHPSRTRRLSIFEAMILQGFPQEYILSGNFSDQAFQNKLLD